MKEKEPKRRFRWTSENEKDSPRKFFENILRNRASKIEQYQFIEIQANRDSLKLNALRHDLDDFLLDLKSWNEDGEARKFLNRMVQNITPDFDAIEAIEQFSDLLNQQIEIADESSMRDRIINIAVHHLRAGNKIKAMDFMKLYSDLKEKNPHFNPSDFVNEIGWIEPTPNTQKDWMDRFDKAEKIVVK